MQTAVLFILFNRPETTSRVFAAIRAAQPKRLYVAVDGPRPANTDDPEKCRQVKEIATAVDWECELITLFRETNLGCRLGPQTAIDWFFQKESEGIILEDDCLPHPDFFNYCEWALATYREDKNIWHINGNNFNCPAAPFLYGKGKEQKLISFSALAQVWGWACWADRWQYYEGDLARLETDSKKGKPRWLISSLAKENISHQIHELQQGKDAWDHQWQLTILNQQGLCVTASSNLISNLGDGDDATHTQKDNRVRLKTDKLKGVLQKEPPRLNKKLTRWYEHQMNLRDARLYFTLKLKSLLRTH